MKYPLITIILFLVLNAIGLFIMLKNPVYEPPYHEPDIIDLTNTDTLYLEIEVLKLKSDTIKIIYEKKINQYRIAPTSERVRLFSKRINR
jgi:hypothetical protein